MLISMDIKIVYTDILSPW